MGDLYHIPGDNGKDYRLKKFVEYQHEVPETHYRFIADYIKNFNIDVNEAIEMSFVLSATYNEITTVFVHVLKEGGKSYEDIWYYKDKLYFGSARKYSKNNNEFVGMMNDFKNLLGENKIQWLKKYESSNAETTYNNIHEAIKVIPKVGRFSADLFLETIIYMKDFFGLNIEQPTILDWKNCANLTSGVYNIFYEDERANNYDKTKKVTDIEKYYLSKKLTVIQKAIGETYPEQNNEICMFIGKICSFRNLFKNARYGGFHHDRELQVLKQYEKDFPGYSNLWKTCYKIRSDIFPKHLLGELNGWEGIRKERKKLWLTTGKTGVERC